MTGLELLILGGGAATLFSSLIALWVFMMEREKAILLSSLGAGFDVLEERRGNIDRPLALVLRGRESVVEVDAVVRGDHTLWQLCQRDVYAPAWHACGVVVVVDVDWVQAVHAARDVPQTSQLSPRYVVHGDNTLLADPDVGFEFATRLRLPEPAKALVITPSTPGRVDVRLELPRVRLTASDAEVAISRLAQVVHMLGGERTRAALPATTHAGGPSGAPFGVPAPA